MKTNTLIEQIENAAKSPIALTAYIILLVVWLLYIIKKSKTTEFVTILESAPKSKINEILKSTGYKYSDIAQLNRKERYKYLMKRYLFIGYIATILCILLIILSFFFYSNSGTTKKLIEQGKESFLEGNIENSRDYYIQALSIDKDNPEAILGKIKSELLLRQYDKASESIIKGFEITQKSNVQKLFSSKLLQYRALVKRHNQEYSSAIEDFKEGINIIKNCKTYECIKTKAASNGNIASIFARQNKFQDAQKYFRNALYYDKMINDEKGELADLSNLSSAYKITGHLDSALVANQKALNIALRLKESRNIIHCYWRFATINELLSSNEVEKFYNEALNHFSASNFKDKRLESRILGDYGAFLFYKLRKTDIAEKKLLRSLQLNVEIKDKSSISSQATTLYEISKIKGEKPYAQAYAITALNFMLDVEEDKKAKFLKDFLKFIDTSKINENISFDDLCNTLEDASGIRYSEWKSIIPANIKLKYL